jgi:uncharacterized membrane protein (Fun14 family)
MIRQVDLNNKAMVVQVVPTASPLHDNVYQWIRPCLAIGLVIGWVIGAAIDLSLVGHCLGIGGHCGRGKRVMIRQVDLNNKAMVVQVVPTASPLHNNVYQWLRQWLAIGLVIGWVIGYLRPCLSNLCP